PTCAARSGVINKCPLNAKKSTHDDSRFDSMMAFADTGNASYDRHRASLMRATATRRTLVCRAVPKHVVSTWMPGTCSTKAGNCTELGRAPDTDAHFAVIRFAQVNVFR